MTVPDIFTVTNEDFARLDAAEAVDFIAQLLWAEAMRIGLPTTHLHITGRVNVKDGGIDGTVDSYDSAKFEGSFVPPGHIGLLALVEN